MFDAATALVVDAVGDALDGVNPNLARLAPPDAPAARSDLVELTARAAAITAAGDPASWLGAVDRWRAKLGELAGHAFGGADAQEAMAVRIVQERLPRIAAFLVTVGVIVTPPREQPSVDWVELRRFVRDPGTLVNEELWDALLGDAGLPGSGRLPAVIVALLILFPQTLLALARDELHVAPLELPPTDGPGPWRDYRTKSAEWLSVTLPLPDFAKPEAERVPRTLFDLASDLAPQMSATLGIRSARRPVSREDGHGLRAVAGACPGPGRVGVRLRRLWFLRVSQESRPGSATTTTAGTGRSAHWPWRTCRSRSARTIPSSSRSAVSCRRMPPTSRSGRRTTRASSSRTSACSCGSGRTTPSWRSAPSSTSSRWS